MRCILNFDDKICAGLIAKAKRRAAGGSINKALQIMVIEWNALEDARNRPEIDQKSTRNQENGQDREDQIDAAFDDLGDAWG